MGKDPAVLFYPNDFIASTALWSDEEVGIYIRLLCYQHISGSIREDDFERICGTYDRIRDKFKTDEQGNRFNERMREESEKRKTYSESRRKNISARYNKKSSSENRAEDMKNICDTYVDTYEEHMGNRNRIRNNNRDSNNSTSNTTTKKKAFIPPTLDEVLEFAKEKDRTDIAKEFFEYFDTGQWVDSKGDKVKSWKQKFLTWCSRNPKKPEVEKPRYGDFDIDEAFERALQRSEEEFELMEG